MGTGDSGWGGSYWGWWSFGPGEPPPKNWKFQYQPHIDKKNAERQIASDLRKRMIELATLIDELRVEMELNPYARMRTKERFVKLKKERLWVGMCIKDLPEMPSDLNEYLSFINRVTISK